MLTARSAVRATLKTVAVLKTQHDRKEIREERERGVFGEVDIQAIIIRHRGLSLNRFLRSSTIDLPLWSCPEKES